MTDTILTARIYLFSVSFIYFIAFLCIRNDWKGLIGSAGLTPAQLYVQKLRLHDTDNQHPTLFKYIDPTDQNIQNVIDLGFTVSILSLMVPNVIFYVILWALYLSIVNVGQTWYSFGWESQLLETGFLAIWLAPYGKRVKESSFAVRAASIFLIFRIMLGAGLIKIRGDPCWRDLTCMHYHYETQPIPNPLSYYLHKMPEGFHKLEVLINHFVELLAPFLMLIPIRCLRTWGGIIQVGFQVLLILSGNLSFLNWLTIVPSLFCFDDDCFRVPRWLKPLLAKPYRESKKALLRRSFNFIKQLGLVVLISYLSYSPILNLLSPGQAMNASFDRYRLVNTYGAFGSVGKERTEIAIFGQDSAGSWKEYYFKCKPGPVDRRPCFLSPYHYRLDWLAWFAGFQNYQYQPWTLNLLYKLMEGNKEVLQLLGHNPFQEQVPQRMKIDLFRYRYGTNEWWEREYISEWLPPVSRKDLEPALRQMGWLAR